MKKEEILKFIAKIKNGELSNEAAIKYLKNYPLNDLGYAKIDTQRAIRNGTNEIIYGENKSNDEILKIALAMKENKHNILITRTNEHVFKLLKPCFKSIKFNERGRIISIVFKKPKITKSYIAIVSAGTSDGDIVEEAYETAKFLGNDVKKITDIGVAGIHRLFSKLDEIQNAKVIVVIAGMEGALPSVIAGLVSSPVIAVPTSIGYGANFGGISALLSMLNSCANSVTVVNIDNGYGAAYNASLINHL